MKVGSFFVQNSEARGSALTNPENKSPVYNAKGREEKKIEKKLKMIKKKKK